MLFRSVLTLRSGLHRTCRQKQRGQRPCSRWPKLLSSPVAARSPRTQTSATWSSRRSIRSARRRARDSHYASWSPEVPEAHDGAEEGQASEDPRLALAEREAAAEALPERRPAARLDRPVRLGVDRCRSRLRRARDVKRGRVGGRRRAVLACELPRAKGQVSVHRESAVVSPKPVRVGRW